MAWTPLRFITRSSHPPHDPIHHATVEYAAVSGRRVGARDNKSAGRLISEVNNAIPDLAVVLQVLRRIHGGHAARAQFFLDGVTVGEGSLQTCGGVSHGSRRDPADASTGMHIKSSAMTSGPL